MLPIAMPRPLWKYEFFSVISVLFALNEMLSSPLYTVKLLKLICDDRIVSAPSVFAIVSQYILYTAGFIQVQDVQLSTRFPVLFTKIPSNSTWWEYIIDSVLYHTINSLPTHRKYRYIPHLTAQKVNTLDNRVRQPAKRQRMRPSWVIRRILLLLYPLVPVVAVPIERANTVPVYPDLITA